MITLPIAFKIVLNLFFYGVYSLIAITIGNFLFGMILHFVLSKGVPVSQDPIHLKIAILVVFLMTLMTVLGRKYFYIPLGLQLSKGKNKKTKIEKPSEEIDNMSDEEFQIYIDKEIK